MPCILLENKADLLKEDNDYNIELEEYAENNGLDGCFRTSAKTGKNVNEAITFLINNITNRLDNLNLTEEKFRSMNIKRQLISEQNVEESEESEELSDQIKKCYNYTHKDTDATNYCYKCQIYLCDECGECHNNLFENHQIDTLDQKTNEKFIGLCKEKKHNLKLEYYCKTHNELCCGLCICKIKGNGNGQHNDCDICLIDDIKKEKKSKFNDNIKKLENFLKELDESIKNMKVTPEEVEKKNVKLKSKIKDTFEKITNELNNRENILFSEIDKYFDENYCINKKSIEIKSLLENINSIDKGQQDDDKLNELIYNCINIENYLKDMNKIREKIDHYYKDDNFNIKLNSNTNNIITHIKKIGYLSDSLILNKYNTINKFDELIRDDKITDNMKLLYRSSRDGINYLNIINAINNKSNLIFLYLTENDKIFGAYIKTKLENIDINGSKKYYKDENAFVFSINNNKKYKILIPEYAISFDNKNYILIGNNDNNNNGFYYCDNIINDKQLINGSKIYDFSKNCELTEGSGKLIELEIFEIN